VFSRKPVDSQLVLKMQARMTTSSSEREFLGNYVALVEIRGYGLYHWPPSHRKQKQQRRDPLPFTGDGDSETEGPRPALAWTILWGGTYSNLLGGAIEREDRLRLWGYVLWDAARLERTRAKEVVGRHWKEIGGWWIEYSGTILGMSWTDGKSASRISVGFFRPLWQRQKVAKIR
jgi:hypothetical protein